MIQQLIKHLQDIGLARCGEEKNMAAKKGLYHNINKRKKAGTSRSKKNSTISAKNYREMQKGFPNSKKNKAKRKRK